MKLIFRRKALLAKKEVTYGVDPGPTGALNAIQTRNLTIEPLNGDQLEFDVDNENLGAVASTMVGRHVRVAFAVAAAGSGTAGTAPAYGPLLEAAGHVAVVTAGTDVTYVPEDTDTNSVTLWVKVDRTLHKVTGARGSLRLVTSKRNYPWLEFEFMGLFSAPIDQAANLDAVYSAFQKPLPFRAATVEFELGTYLAGLHELNISFGQQVEFYEHSESEQIVQIDRRGSWQGTVEEPDVGTHDFYADIAGDTLMALNYVHGLTPGNIFEVVVPATQLLSPRRGDQQGIAALQLNGPLIRQGATPEYSIIVR